MEYFIAALIIAVIVLIVYALLRKKKTKPSEPPVRNLLAVPEEDEKTPENEPPVPVTFTEDLEFSFDGLNEELEDALTEHSLFYSAQTAVKPEYNAPKAPPQPEKPKAPAVDATAYLAKTTQISEEDACADEEALCIIKSFLAGNYYFDGEMIANGEKSPMEIAMRGNDFQVYSELDGKDISIMQSDSKTYMLNPDTKKYTELTASFQKMVGIDISNQKFAFNSNGVDANNPTAVKKAVFNGNEAVCIIYKSEQTHLEFIVSGAEILQMTLFNPDAVAINILIADEFTAEIPENMLTFKGYSKTNMISFLTSLM